MKKLLILSYGVASYLAFVLVFGYTILFIGNIGVSPSLDSVGDTNLLQALLIDVALLGAFALQHSIMARPAFKRLLTRYIPSTIERSTYVLSSSLLLGLVVYFWQPLGGVIWQTNDVVLTSAIYSLFFVGWTLLFIASCQINHFDLFGLRQVWLEFLGKPYTQIAFKTPWLYRYMRHPLYVGMMIGLWATPVMTVAHLVFALLSTGYIFIGARLEENDLERELPEYKTYKQQVAMFIPLAKVKRKPINEIENEIA